MKLLSHPGAEQRYLRREIEEDRVVLCIASLLLLLFKRLICLPLASLIERGESGCMTMTFLKRKVTPIELGLDNGSKCKHKEAYLYKKQDHLQPLPFFVSSPQDSLFADRVHESQGVL